MKGGGARREGRAQHFAFFFFPLPLPLSLFVFLSEGVLVEVWPRVVATEHSICAIGLHLWSMGGPVDWGPAEGGCPEVGLVEEGVFEGMFKGELQKGASKGGEGGLGREGGRGL